MESGAAGHKQRRKAENSHCAARRAHHHHAGHVESTAGLASMREQMRQAIKQKPTVSPCKQMPLSSQREGPMWRPVSGRKKGPRSVSPNRWGSHPWGLLRGRKTVPKIASRIGVQMAFRSLAQQPVFRLPAAFLASLALLFCHAPCCCPWARVCMRKRSAEGQASWSCLLYTSDAADE